ncbi:CYTH domain-containing protein [Rossellomorea vietnamensis]|uniref:CYTH domain-containing protein n=1 Tax=Rossellomorea vietnamensis TaxID=218284 RepID=A0A5D4NNV6_9BACI|nr:CYTH domain-containing protein [Rossellomorea vietnamensis]TYS15817.1 CYTH domain-containing protein [Rossellomorea vietnamensis]
MPEELEIEFKNMLTQGEFNCIKKHFSFTDKDFTLQKNHYFDTLANDLREKQCALRIREKNGKFEFTLKQPADGGLLETNQTITEHESSKMLAEGFIPPGEVESALKKLGIETKKFLHFGTLSTKRAESRYKDGLMVLDYSFYLNNEDFELEYEVNDRESGQEKFFDFLKTMNIPIRHADNKIKRFLRAVISD